ncbi:MAG: hypothetical protein ASARMPREDX12_005961 [Alectoria sarmentosa]|nr:MAG: hypothetical protein ASARMPREDX12_005961 [Alectoria sarmentosa]
MSIPELEEALQRYSVNSFLSHIDPVRVTRVSPRMDSPRQPLLPDRKPTESQLESQDQNDYGTVDAPRSKGKGLPSDAPPSPAEHTNLLEDPTAAMARRSVKKALPILAIGVLLAAIDTSIITANYAIIGTELGALNLVSWIATAYFLATASSQPLYGKFSDTFGRKPCLLFSYTVFLLGVLMCGFAQSMEWFIAARVLQGIGGGGMITLIAVIFSDVIPLKERGLWQGYLNILYAIGMSIGAPLGGMLAEAVGWRWIFIGQAPIALIAILAITFILQLPTTQDAKTADGRSKLWQIDYLGGILIIGTIVSFLLGLEFGSNDGWSASACIVPLALSPILLALFILVENTVATNPFIPGRIIFNKSLSAVYGWNLFSSSGWFCFFFFLPLFYQAVLQFDAAHAGMLLLPGVVASTVGNFAGGFFVKRTGKYYWAALASSAAAAAGFVPVIVSARPEIRSIVGISVGLAVVGFSQGVNIPLLNNVDKSDQAIATACFYVFSQLGSAVGTSVAGTIIQHVLRTRLDDLPGAVTGIANARDSLDFVGRLAPELQLVVRGIYAEAIGAAFAFAAGNYVVAFLCAMGIRENAL